MVWNINFETDTNVVDVAIRRLRAKIDDHFAPKLIYTVRGMAIRSIYTMKIMNRLSLASRLSIAFSLISCVVFISICGLSYQSFREMVYTQQDKALTARIKRMEVF
jgi:hypothetical protein